MTPVYCLRLVSRVPTERIHEIAESVAIAANVDPASIREAISQPPGTLVVKSGSLSLVTEVKVALRLEGIITDAEQIPADSAAYGRPERPAARPAHPMPPAPASTEVDGGFFRPPATELDNAETEGPVAAPNSEGASLVSMGEGATGPPNRPGPPTSPDAGPQDPRRSRARGYPAVFVTALLAIAVVIIGSVWKGGGLGLSPTHGPGTVDTPRQASAAYIERALGDCRVLEMWRYEGGSPLAGVLTRCQQPDGIQRFRLDYDLGFLMEETVVATEDIWAGVRFNIARTETGLAGDYFIVNDDGSVELRDKDGLIGAGRPMR